jgi:uncharacterized membrane protein
MADDEALDGRDLSGTDLSGSNFAGQDLSDANLRGTNLSGANLASADLADADLRDADLGGANLSGANLVGADLDGATLTGANLSGAVLEAGDAASGDSPLVSLVQAVVTGAVISLGVFLFVADWSLFWLVFVIGFVAVLPAATKLAEWYESRSTDVDETEPEDDDEQASALATLRDRYASGEIDEAEFERRVERLLETESVADAEDAYGGATMDAEPEKEPE